MKNLGNWASNELCWVETKPFIRAMQTAIDEWSESLVMTRWLMELKTVQADLEVRTKAIGVQSGSVVLAGPIGKRKVNSILTWLQETNLSECEDIEEA